MTISAIIFIFKRFQILDFVQVEFVGFIFVEELLGFCIISLKQVSVVSPGAGSSISTRNGICCTRIAESISVNELILSALWLLASVSSCVWFLIVWASLATSSRTCDLQEWVAWSWWCALATISECDNTLSSWACALTISTLSLCRQAGITASSLAASTPSGDGLALWACALASR